MKTIDTLKKEAHDIITDAIMDGQNQIHDLRSERATPDEITKRMENTFKYCSDRLDKVLDRIHAATVEECIGSLTHGGLKEWSEFERGWNCIAEESNKRLQALITEPEV
jgi:hypothetical protein